MKFNLCISAELMVDAITKCRETRKKNRSMNVKKEKNMNLSKNLQQKEIHCRKILTILMRKKTTSLDGNDITYGKLGYTDGKKKTGSRKTSGMTIHTSVF